LRFYRGFSSEKEEKSKSAGLKPAATKTDTRVEKNAAQRPVIPGVALGGIGDRPAARW
jgi:hypothetical protein